MSPDYIRKANLAKRSHIADSFSKALVFQFAMVKDFLQEDLNGGI